MLFITHLIVNERKCNQQLLSTLYMESRRLLSPEKMWPLMGAQEISAASLLGVGVGVGCVTRGREQSCKYEESTTFKNPLLPQRVTCGQSLGLKFWLKSILTLLCIAFPHLPHDNWGYFLHTFSSQVEQRNMLKASGTAGGKRDRNRERDGRKEARIFQGVYSCFLSFFLAPEAIDSCLLSRVGLGQVLLGAGHACSLQGDTRCCLAWSCIAHPLEVALS